MESSLDTDSIHNKSSSQSKCIIHTGKIRFGCKHTGDTATRRAGYSFCLLDLASRGVRFHKKPAVTVLENIIRGINVYYVGLPYKRRFGVIRTDNLHKLTHFLLIKHFPFYIMVFVDLYSLKLNNTKSYS